MECICASTTAFSMLHTCLSLSDLGKKTDEGRSPGTSPGTSPGFEWDDAAGRFREVGVIRDFDEVVDDILNLGTVTEVCHPKLTHRADDLVRLKKLARLPIRSIVYDLSACSESSESFL